MYPITAWYSWCSPYLIDVSKKPKDTKCLEKDDMIKVWTVKDGESNNVKDGIGAMKSKGKKELKENRINRAKYREMGDGYDWEWK